MSTSAKNKWLTAAVVILLAGNIATLALFWIENNNKPSHPEPASDFIIRELSLDQQQKEQYLTLVKEHREKVQLLRGKIKETKDNFFDLLKQPQVTDSMKSIAAGLSNSLVQQLDIMTFDHFQKVRALCRPDQQLKFDTIIHSVLRMMAEPGPGGPPGPKGPGMKPPPPPGQ